jgi:hypothetical protein
VDVANHGGIVGNPDTLLQLRAVLSEAVNRHVFFLFWLSFARAAEWPGEERAIISG